jgi:hypothetical protein
MISQSIKQTADGSNYVNLQDKDGTGISSTLNSGKQSLDVNVTSAIDISLDAASDSVEVKQASHDDLNANANLQVGDADVSNSNPVPISDGGGVITVDGSVTVSATDLDIRNLSSGQDSVAAVQSGAWNVGLNAGSNNIGSITNITGTVSLPTGAATEASLAAINGKLSPSSAALSSVNASTSSQSILASNASRKSFILVNDSNGTAHVAFAATATTSAFSIKLQANAAYEPPNQVYTGAISCIWTGALLSGAMRVTELT